MQAEVQKYVDNAVSKTINLSTSELDLQCNGHSKVPVDEPENMLKCEVCGQELNRAEGCYVCRVCGFSKC